MIEVRQLCAYAGETALVREVSFTVGPGRVLALIGESGSGKTTIGLALLGEARPGVRLTGTARVAGRIGYVQQNPAAALNPARRVGAVLREFARAAGRPARDAVAQALDSARIPLTWRELRRYPHQFSGGQQQRLVLAEALAGGPSALMLDEPTTGLDPLTRDAVIGEIAALARRGLAIVIATHDLGAARRLADDVVVLRDGQVCESGPAARVLHAPSHAYTRQLLAAEQHPRAGGSLAAAEPVLEVEGLTAGYRQPVIQDISFAVPGGSRLAVVGASGSGKTTLARCLAGLHEPAAGTIRLRGERLAAHLGGRSLAQRRAIQYVFQDARAAFDPRRTVRDQVARTAIRLRGMASDEARAHADATLGRLGVGSDTASRMPAGLSGGELQRAALARALLAEPEVLVCDEVTSALDTVTRNASVALLAGLPGTLVLITHDLGLVSAVADTVAVVADGRLTRYGPVDAVLAETMEDAR
ncbi:ABC transporter ATP-binding protein [Allorhizocola rhizosphaerae]|uniref:ABC transporter ATP-binding protein n=1 Tax=Allorhizocola rhizosphaerae TaxID=1872709 RepID=UPI000E3DBFC7|nr:ATP-binding cassette domain-containing protein [Allorhizocola rhizosphaerae]